jgi:hypothetical protein
MEQSIGIVNGLYLDSKINLIANDHIEYFQEVKKSYLIGFEEK